ncbi:MAG: hypothetical protein HND47_19500 [Chloroflexi bacterium]|nr:hypothetical protein [Chloroflexota bacterium]
MTKRRSRSTRLRRWGPGGHFLAQKHTRNHMRDLFLPQFLDRRPYTEWETKKDDARDWALNKARKILKEHQPDPLDKKISKEFERIIKSVENLKLQVSG